MPGLRIEDQARHDRVPRVRQEGQDGHRQTVVRNGWDYETERTIDYGDEDSLKLTLIKYGMSAISCLMPVIFVVAYLWLF